jgi:hypothetical protein
LGDEDLANDVKADEGGYDTAWVHGREIGDIVEDS